MSLFVKMKFLHKSVKLDFTLDIREITELIGCIDFFSFIHSGHTITDLKWLI